MPRATAPASVDDLISRLAAAVSSKESPEDAVQAWAAALSASLPGLKIWVLRREVGGQGLPAVWIPTGPTPPFPDEILARPGSIAAAALAGGGPGWYRPARGGAERVLRAPESSYLKRRGGTWLFLPVPLAGPAGIVVLSHPDGDTLEGFLEVVGRAARLAQPHLGLLAARREVDRRIEERTAELALFYETMRALTFAKTETDIATLLGHILGPAIGVEMLGLLVLGQGRADLHVEVIGKTGPSALRSFRRSIVGQAAAMLGVSIPSVRVRVNRPARLVADGAAQGADLHVPLIVHDSRLGLLAIRSDGPAVDEMKARLFFTVASQAALTLERVRTTQEARLLTVRSVLNSMRQGVILVDRSLEVVMANPAAESLSALLLGGPLPARLRRLGGIDLAPVVESLAAGEEAPPPVQLYAREHDRTFHMTVSPAVGLRGHFEGAILVLGDVTEEKRVQEQLMQTEKLSSLGEMISGVAHELNNPLASIMGNAQLLDMKEGIAEDVRKKVATISSEADRCHRIMQNLLRFARKQAPERRPVDLNSVVGSVVQLLGYQLQADNIALDVDLDREMLPVMGDFHTLQQVFVNLVTNAHHTMKEKGGRGVLSIVTRCDGLTCRAEVSDTGAGIRPEHLKKVFDPFFTTKEAGRGTGLGLSLAYGTIKEHQGSITARSRPGSGSTFTVEIPVVAGAPRQAEIQRGAVAPAGTLVTSGRRILVVEDEESLSQMICEALIADGHSVERAADGLAARELLAKGSYDLIISDLKMPNMDGRELYDAVSRTNPDLARRIVFSTGDTVSADTQDFFKRTGNPFISKPFSLSELYTAVHSALRGA